VNAEGRWRTFLNGDIGISNLTVENVTADYSVNSGLLEAGLGVGEAFQLTRNWGIEATTRASYGMSFTSVSCHARMLEAMLGVSRYF
jgi:hypothetical protein